MKQRERAVSPFSNEARNTYVVEHITDALLELMRDCPMQQLSVSEICDKAGVGRVSFYRNFGSKEEILRRYDRRIVRATFESQKPDDRSFDATAFVQALLHHYKLYQDFYTLLYRDGLSHIVLDTINSFIGPQKEDESIVALSKAFLSYGLYGIVDEWVARGMKEPESVVAALMKQ
ncbi:MAG: TetR/AcrR family transcriptional regulator [Clostridia bacterium]|nr:TetR/AcrR family transcriptional regulator [Clostridia bacterium]